MILKMPNLIGFDNLLETMQRMAEAKVPAWPPYNVRKEGDNKYVIEMALAGFGNNDIEITIENNVLSIKGRTESAPGEYLFKGIADRAFERTFTLNDAIKVENASLVNGMLRVWLEQFVPKKDTRKIEVK